MYKTTGFISFFLRRLTGVILVLYLFTHLMVIGSANGGAESFNKWLGVVQTPVFKLLEIGLLAAVIYHGIDGIRLLVIQYFDITDKRKALFYTALVLSAILVVAGGVPMLIFALGEF
jgi:succinate dehydrogenase / fumarate reductase cytochrome b subunit